MPKICPPYSIFLTNGNLNYICNKLKRAADQKINQSIDILLDVTSYCFPTFESIVPFEQHLLKLTHLSTYDMLLKVCSQGVIERMI